MHVLIIPSWYENNTNPTLGSFFREQAEGLEREGMKVTVAYPGFNGVRTLGKNNIGRCTYVKNNIHIYRYDTYNYFFDRFYNDLKKRIFKYKLFKLYSKIELERGRPDIIHAHSAVLASYGATELGKKYNIPVVITEHSSAFLQHKFKKDSLKLISKSLNECDSLITVSEGLKENITQYTVKNNIKVLPNIVDVKKFNIDRSEKSSGFTFLSICYLSHNKGLDILLKAFAKAFKGKKDVKLRIGGDGNELAMLLKLSEELQIKEQVDFLGALNREEVAFEMKKASCFVMPSRFETFGVVLIEAMASGLPVISTKTSGPIDIVNSKNGMLVDIENIGQLENAMLYVKNNIKEYDGIEIRNECIEKYSSKAVIEKLINIYSDIIANRRKK